MGHHSDDSAGTASGASGRLGSADEGTVCTTATSVRDDTSDEGRKQAAAPSPPTRPVNAVLLERDEPASAPVAEAEPATVPSVPHAEHGVQGVHAEEPGHEADNDSDDDDGVLYVDTDDDSSDEEEAAGSPDEELVLACGCNGGPAASLPPPINLQPGQFPWLSSWRNEGSHPDGLAVEEDAADDDPALLEAERILLTTPEPYDDPRRSTETLNIRPLSGFSQKRPSLPLPALPTAASPRSADSPVFAYSRMVPREIAPGTEEDDRGGETTETEKTRQNPHIVVDLPPRPVRRRTVKLRRHRRSSSTGSSGGSIGGGRRKKPPFDRFTPPSDEALEKALACELATESGETISFGDMLRQRNHEKVVVIFLRHAWCGLCQQYVEALNRASLNLVTVTGAMFADLGGRGTSRLAPLDVVLINSSNPALIGPYRTRHRTPFPLFSDRRRKLYKALGMTRKTWDMGKEGDKGSYIVKSQLQNVTSSISAGVKLPKYPGSQTQLGGEFVFEYLPETDSFKCLFVSRMHNTRAHAEIRDVFAAAGIELDEADAESVFGA